MKTPLIFLVVSCVILRRDYISDEKDSLGIWDSSPQEEIFRLIETENIPKVLLISEDHHWAHDFIISRKSGFKFFEIEGVLGRVSGREAIAKDPEN